MQKDCISYGGHASWVTIQTHNLISFTDLVETGSYILWKIFIYDVLLQLCLTSGQITLLVAKATANEC